MRSIVVWVLAVTGLAACGGKIQSDGTSSNGGTAATDVPTKPRPPGGGAPGSGSGGGNDSPPPPTSDPTAPSGPTSGPDVPVYLGPCSVSFGEVLTVMQGWGCSQTHCHGGTFAANPPFIEPTSPYASWKSMAGLTLSDGRAYLVPRASNPTAAGVHCNLRGECGVAMPIPRRQLDAADLTTVDTWLACGAPEN